MATREYQRRIWIWLEHLRKVAELKMRQRDPRGLSLAAEIAALQVKLARQTKGGKANSGEGRIPISVFHEAIREMERRGEDDIEGDAGEDD